MLNAKQVLFIYTQDKKESLFMTLVLPEKFEAILSKNDRYRAETLRLTTTFSDWVQENTLEFFPEYTDHGIDHIQSVLNTAETIISLSSWQMLTPEDIFVLVSAILLHDSAMHIDKYGLWELLSNDKFNGAVLGRRIDKTWAEKWDNFKKSVNRFEESEWYNFFGTFESITIPDINETNLTDNQKIIIGDFVRQYHADIAQLIASFGIPHKGGSEQIFNSEFTSLNELSGFIARSHNYSLRNMVDELGGDQRAREYHRTHPAFLMGVLRIADYLQFDQNRTPKILFRIKGRGMCSPISIQEWKKHLSILSSSLNNSDTELLFVESLPEDALTLENIKNLFIGFQKELDSFWAVNGEVYSRYPDLASFGLKLRRIKSNIDDAANFVEEHHKSFYPEILNIKSDNQKILPLLVGPLYGNTPEIGLRELIQNSIDACNERYSLETGQEVNKEKIPYKLVITIDMDQNTLTIEDDGIGMDIDVIKNYFLKIGASYRYSEVWKANHSNEGKIYVPRTGKFGIGMLAGFLIGNEVYIISKKEGEPNNKAIEFSYKLNSTDIQVNFTDRLEVGTKIVIQSDEEKLQKIINGFETNETYKDTPNTVKSFWYFLDTPMIDIKIVEDEKISYKYNPHIIKKEDIFSEWNAVLTTELQGYFWRPTSGYWDDSNLYCNGILIRDFKVPTIQANIGLTNLKIESLVVSIFDNFGKFPLNLTRDHLVTKDFFEIDKLSDSVFNNYYGKIKKLIDGFSWSKKNILSIFKTHFLSDDNNILPFVFLNNKVVPIGCSSLNNEYFLFDYLLSSQKRGIIYNDNAFSLLDNIGYCCINDAVKESYTTKNAILKFVLNKCSHSKYYSTNSDDWTDTGLNLDGWVYIKNYDLEKISYEMKTEFNSYDLTVTKIDEKWSVLSNESNSKVIPELGKNIITCDNLNSFIFVICKFNESVETEFSSLWDKYILQSTEEN